MADLNKYSPAFFEPDIVQDPTTFGEAVEAVEGLRVAPLIDAVRMSARYGNREPQAGYNFLKDLGNYEAYAPALASAVSPEHMAELKRSIDLGIERRQALSQASTMTMLGAGFLDPINLFAIPFGGPTVGIVRSALRTGAGVATVEAISEAVNLSLDPVKTAEEAAINVAAAGLFGAGFGAVLSVPTARRAAAFEATQIANKELSDAAIRIEGLAGMTADDIAAAGPRADRPLNDLDDAKVRDRINELEGQAAELESRGLNEQASDVRSGTIELKQELAIRNIEELGVDVKDPFAIKDSWFTNSVLYKAVSTPMKRVLQASVPSKVKETFVRGFGDGGITLAMNSFGIATPQSAYQRAAVANGNWVRAQDELSRLWAAETGASTASRLDINATDLGRRASRSPLTYRKWLTSVSEKRVKGDTNLSENELKASSVINKYFDSAETRLQDVGLLGNERGMNRRIEMMEAEIASLRDTLAGIKKGTREEGMVKGRMSLLKDDVKSLKKMSFAPDSSKSPEPFFPRFFDKGYISKNRDAFSKVLFDWFTENPHIYMLKKGVYERVELSRDPTSVQKRVDDVIDGILGDADPASLGSLGFGSGRSKHFRSRQLDIPNSLVSDFIIKDPLGVMKTYAARIEPRYEFMKQFGKDVDGVRFDIELEMVRDGAAQQEINAVMRDFQHMYDRVAGVVQENPDAWNQKIAFFLREAASFSYMGSSGLAAIPDFGRIVMEHDMEDVIKGIQGILDRERLNMTVDEVRIAGEAIDILRGSAHMRMMEDLGNNVDANEMLSTARNAFYILNGLAPMTTLAKQLAGVIDSHQIIKYSIALGKGQLDDQGIEWLARYGIDEAMAEKIAKSPWQQSEAGLYMANTEEWVDSIYIPEIEGKRVSVIEMNDDGSPAGKTVRGRYIPAFYNDKKKTINFDREYIEGPMFEEKAWLNPKVEGVKALPDIFDAPRQWANFVMLHEINHSRFRAEDLGFVKTPDFARMSDDELGNWFDWLVKEVQSREKQSDPATWSDAEKRAYRSGNWRRFSELRGYTEGEMRQYNQFLLAEAEYRGRFDMDESASRAFSVSERLDEIKRPDSIEIDKVAYENKINELALKDYREAQTINEETVSSFRTALNSGVLNTIMSGTPADKPIITDGVVYIPMRVASQFGMKEHPKYKGYARVENGLMGLPFQFYSFVLANVNKTVAAMAHGQVKNRALGITTMMGLAYMSLSIRTPDYIWEEMSFRDRFARSFDMSGVMALYSDLLYTGMHTSLALGGPNITAGLLQPKFNQQVSGLDAATGLAGAGPSWGVDTASGVVDFLSGNYAEGGKDVVRNLPFMRLWFLKDDVNQITNGWGN